MLSLGSNAGDRGRLLESARKNIAETVGPLLLASREYRTEPWGNFAETGPVEPFLNQVVLVETDRNPEEVLNDILRIERRIGRPEHDPEYTTDGQRVYRSRVIDIDILFFDSEIIDTPRLAVPHPRIAQRRFVLEPAAEICPDFQHPVLKISLKELLNSIL